MDRDVNRKQITKCVLSEVGVLHIVERSAMSFKERLSKIEITERRCWNKYQVAYTVYN